MIYRQIWYFIGSDLPGLIFVGQLGQSHTKLWRPIRWSIMQNIMMWWCAMTSNTSYIGKIICYWKWPPWPNICRSIRSILFKTVKNHKMNHHAKSQQNPTTEFENMMLNVHKLYNIKCTYSSTVLITMDIIITIRIIRIILI